MHLIEPTREQVLDFCAASPIERVFLEDVARAGVGRFTGVENVSGRLVGLCHVGANIVPSGEGCGAFARVAAAGRARMIIGEQGAVGELWHAARRDLPEPREDRPNQPVYVLTEPPEPGGSGLRPATAADVERLLPACAAAHRLELGIDPLARDAEGFRWRTRAQVEDGRSWLWLEDDVILFKAEASAWTNAAVQVAQVWVDPVARGQGYGARGLRDLCRLLLERTPAVTLFVRSDNAAGIALYDAIGMRRALAYRSVLF
jgi:ribosomal protein S18 acetylase RimI-like enzyme